MNAADFAGESEMAAWVARETPAGRWAQPQEVAKLSLFQLVMTLIISMAQL